MLFSKFKPVNAKTSFDQLFESSTGDDDFIINKNNDIDIELLAMKPNNSNQSTSKCMNYIYENNSIQIDENFLM